MAKVSKRTWQPGQRGGNRKLGGGRQGESWQVDYTDEDGKRRKKSGFRTKSEAEFFAVEKQKAINDGVSRSKGDQITLEELKNEFLVFARQRAEREIIGQFHVQNMEAHFRNYIARTSAWEAPRRGKISRPFSRSIGHLKLSQIKASTLNTLRDDLFSAGLSYTNVRAIINSLAQALKYAKSRDYVAFNVAQGIEIEVAPKERNLRVTPPSKSLLASVIQSAPPTFRLLIQFSACTGVRGGELRALRFRHLDLDKGVVSIKSAVKRDGRDGEPKSKAGIRKIPLSPALIELLRAHREQLGASSPSALVFAAASGEVLKREVLLRQLNKITVSLGIGTASEDPIAEDEDDDDEVVEGRFTWHAIRHYAISSWIAAGLGLKAVQVFAGHADVTTTWNRYGHLFPDEDHWNKIAIASEGLLTAAHTGGAKTEQRALSAGS